MRDIKYMKLRSFNAVRAELFGYELTLIDKMIMLRSPIHTHTEIQHSDRYGGNSFSATMADDCKCCRFKLIGYSHPEFWDTVLIPCTAEQEALVWAENCRMADMSTNTPSIWGVIPNAVYYGVGAMEYDLMGLLSFATKFDVIKYDKDKRWCTRACYDGLIKVWDILAAVKLETHDLTPDLGDMIARSYFAKLG